MTEINNKTSSSFDETIARISDVAKQTRKVGIDLLRSINNVIEEEKTSENTNFTDYIKECLNAIYQERFKNKRRFRYNDTFKILLTLACHKAGYDIWENNFAQFRMTYYNAYMRYNELPEEEKQKATSVQKLADEYKKGQTKNKREDSSPKTLKECLTDFLKRHKEMMSEATEPMTITLGNVTYTLSILSENSE